MKRLMDVLTSLHQMPFVKKVKNDAYFSRFQVKYRRRREGKTDCTLLCLTDEVYVTISYQITRANGWWRRQKTSSKSFFMNASNWPLNCRLSNAPKYRLVVRFTNKDIIVQIVYARLQGDFVLAAAHSRELPRYGINHGLTNWAAGITIFMIKHAPF